jgi:BioD-like phosphotransacetylase family protein
MVSLLIASRETAGKTALCTGIGRKLLGLGKKVGYFLPIQLTDGSNTNGYKDASFVKEALELEESAELLSPTSLSIHELWQSLTDNPEELVQKIKKNYARISKGKDIIIIEGISGLVIDNVATLACYNVAEALDTKVIILLRYFPGLAPSDIARVAEELGQRLLGIIINFVPEPQIATVKQNITTSFEKAGIKILGIIPEVRSLLGVSVEEMAEALGGNILTCPENADELVENIMLGAMTIDSGIEYFNHKRDKAVIIRGDRPDMQLAALQTPTKCLVITNNARPLATVVSESESKHVPVMVVSKGTSDTVAAIEHLLANSAFNSSRKLKKFEDILDKYLDFNSLYPVLGL